MRLRQVEGTGLDVRLLKCGSVNAYVAKTVHDSFLVDCGMPWHGSKLAEIAQRSGVRAILVTHGHLDHIGGLAKVHRALRGPVLSSSLEAAWLASGRLVLPAGVSTLGKMVRIAWRMLPIPTPLPCVPTRELDPDVDLSSQGVPARALATPGHSPGHLAFLFPGGILFSGDAVVGSSRGPWPVFPMFGDDEAEMKRSIRKLASLEGVEWVFPGHGHPFPHSALREFAAKL